MHKKVCFIDDMPGVFLPDDLYTMCSDILYCQFELIKGAKAIDKGLERFLSIKTTNYKNHFFLLDADMPLHNSVRKKWRFQHQFDLNDQTLYGFALADAMVNEGFSFDNIAIISHYPDAANKAREAGIEFYSKTDLDTLTLAKHIERRFIL